MSKVVQAQQSVKYIHPNYMPAMSSDAQKKLKQLSQTVNAFPLGESVLDPKAPKNQQIRVVNNPGTEQDKIQFPSKIYGNDRITPELVLQPDGSTGAGTQEIFDLQINATVAVGTIYAPQNTEKLIQQALSAISKK